MSETDCEAITTYGNRLVYLSVKRCHYLLRALQRFANSVAGEPITAVLLPLTELQAEAALEAQHVMASERGG